MRRLVLISMVACIATLATGCIISSGDDDSSTGGFITADWAFHNVAKSQLSCPSGFGTAQVTATPVGGGTKIIDKYDCAALTGRADYPVGAYDVDIDITDNASTTIYESSLTERVDITTADATVQEDFIDDGGRLILDWVLVTASNQPTTCTAAGVTRIGIDGTLGANLALSDDLPCGDASGVSLPTVAGTYTVSIGALNSAGQMIGNPTVKSNVPITAPNGYTDLQTVTVAAQ